MITVQSARDALTTIRTDGFITNIKSSNPFDVIRADVVLERMEKQANNGCGLYYEIYESRLLNMAMHYLDSLPLKDRQTFILAAESRGLTLNQDELCRAEDACDDIMRELRADY